MRRRLHFGLSISLHLDESMPGKRMTASHQLSRSFRVLRTAGMGPSRVKTPNLVFSLGVRGDRDEAFC